jgi:hypothetical protein
MPESRLEYLFNSYIHNNNTPQEREESLAETENNTGNWRVV